MKTGDWQRLEHLAALLEDAWDKTQTVNLEQLLPPANDPLRPVVLREFVKTELEIRWRKGRGVTIDEYLSRFPELVPTAELLYEEYRVRQRYGDHPGLDSYKDRFAALYDELQRLVAATPVPTVPSVAFGAPEHPTNPSVSPKPMPSNHLPDIPGGYVTVRLLGRGGFGEVWEAVAPGGFHVAVKVINRPADHEERQREERSLDVIKELRHHFLIKTHATYSEEDRLYIVMDLADGSLRERLKQCKKDNTTIPLPEVLFYLHEAAEALDYLHEKSVLHRDIKPDNILLVDQHVRLADFGLARYQEQILATVSGSGTPAYMAPEVWRGKASKASDLYSLAYTYAELRLGRRPFASTDHAGVMFDHLDHTPDLEPLPDPEKQVLLVALAKQPGERYPACMDFVHELELATGVSASRPRSVTDVGGLRGAEAAPRPANRGSGTQRIVSVPPPARPAAAAPPPPGEVEHSGPTENLESLVPHQRPRGEPSVAPQSPTHVDPLPRAKERGKPRPVGKIVAALSLLVFLLVGAPLLLWAAIVWGGSRPATTVPAGPITGSFTLVPAAPQNWRPGTKAELRIEVQRDHWDKEIQLKFVADGLPLTIADAIISPGESAMRVPVTVGTWAGKSDGGIVVRAKSGDLEREATVKVHLEPPGFGLNFRAVGSEADGDFDGHKYYREIETTLPGVPPTVFVLVPRQSASDPPSFYLTRAKVSNTLYAALDPGAGHAMDNQPAVQLTAEQADAAARKLGGLLPTVRQYDKALGFLGHEKEVGPVGPVAAGIQDLVGTGWEFTRNLTTEEGSPAEDAKVGEKTVPLPNAPKGTLVILRGQLPAAKQPLRFEDLRAQQTTPLVQFYGSASPVTGFRVVIEPK